MAILRAHGFLSPPASKAAKRMLRGAVEGLAPFRAKTINLSYDFDIDFNRYRLLVEAVGADWVVVGETALTRDEMLNDPDADEWTWRVREEIKMCIRNRRGWPVEDNVILGEN